MERCKLKVLIAFVIIFLTVSFAWSVDNDKSCKEVISQGDKLIVKGKFQDALDKYKSALKINPDSSDAYYKIGVANYFLRNFDDSVLAYKKSIELNQKHFKAYNNLGLVLEKQGKIIEASEMYEKAYKANPKYKKALYNLGKSLYSRRLLKRANKVILELINNYPNFQQGYFLMGLVAEQSDEYDKAKEMYKKAAKIVTLEKKSQDAIKRLNKRVNKMKSHQKDISKAKEIIDFLIPAGYGFKDYKEYPSGIKSICFDYEDGGNILIVKIPDKDSIFTQEMSVILEKPSDEVKKQFNKINITDIEIIDVGIFDLENPDKEKIVKDEAKKLEKYVFVKCKVNGEKYKGLVLKIPCKEEDDESVLIYMGLAPENKFNPIIPQIFFSNLGGKEKAK